MVSGGSPHSDPLIPYIQRDFKGENPQPKCPRCGEKMKFMRDGGSVSTWVCDEDRLVLSCSHHLNNNLTGFWKVLKDTPEGKIVIDGKGWL